MRKDHLMLITDAGVTLHAGWDYGAPYSFDPLNGVSVDLKLAQGVNQTGSTVEQQSVAGVYRELIIDFWGSHGEADSVLWLNALPYFTRGTLYFGDKWFCRFVLSKTPYTKQIEPFPQLDIMLYCEKPFWYGLTAQSYTLGGFTPGFKFPVNYHTHRYSAKNEATFVNVQNPGSLSVPFTATLRCTAPVKNPRVIDVLRGDFIGLVGFDLEPGDTVEFYRTTTDRLAVKRTRAGEESNLFAYLDEDSTLTELPAGDNLLKAEADSGADALQATISFYPMYTGIIPEVMTDAT